MYGGKDRLFIRQPFLSPFEKVGSEEGVVDNDPRQVCILDTQDNRTGLDIVDVVFSFNISSG